MQKIDLKVFGDIFKKIKKVFSFGSPKKDWKFVFIFSIILLLLIFSIDAYILLMVREKISAPVGIEKKEASSLKDALLSETLDFLKKKESNFNSLLEKAPETKDPSI